jgi:AraC family transcriptional regulator
MDTTTEIPTLWNQLAETMYLKDSATAEVTLSELASFSFGRVKNSEGLPEIARPIAGQRGYLVALQLKAISFIEQFFGSKKVSSGTYPVGAVSVIDLREEPAVLLPHPFDALVLHVTHAALGEIAYARQAPRVEELVWPLGQVDSVVYHLGENTAPAISGWPLFSADAKSDRAPGGSSGWQYYPPASRGSM